MRKPIQTRLYTFPLCLAHARVCMHAVFLDYTPTSLLPTPSVPYIVTAPGPLTAQQQQQKRSRDLSSETS